MKTQKGSELISRKEVKDTPFTIISLNDKSQHFATLGEYRITEIYDKVNKAEEEVVKITWNRLIQVIMILQEKNKNNELVKLEVK